MFLLYIFASIVSFTGLYSIAAWLKLPENVYFAFPLAIDLGIILFKVAEVVLRYDVRKANKVKKAVFGVFFFTAVSSLGNIVHVANDPDSDPLKLWGGILFAGLMPWIVYLAASVLTDLIVKPLTARRSAQSSELEVSMTVDELDAVKWAAKQGMDATPAAAVERYEEARREHRESRTFELTGARSLEQEW